MQSGWSLQVVCLVAVVRCRPGPGAEAEADPLTPFAYSSPSSAVSFSLGHNVAAPVAHTAHAVHHPTTHAVHLPTTHAVHLPAAHVTHGVSHASAAHPHINFGGSHFGGSHLAHAVPAATHAAHLTVPASHHTTFHGASHLAHGVAAHGVAAHGVAHHAHVRTGPVHHSPIHSTFFGRGQTHVAPAVRHTPVTFFRTGNSTSYGTYGAKEGEEEEERSGAEEEEPREAKAIESPDSINSIESDPSEEELDDSLQAIEDEIAATEQLLLEASELADEAGSGEEEGEATATELPVPEVTTELNKVKEMVISLTSDLSIPHITKIQQLIDALEIVKELFIRR